MKQDRLTLAGLLAGLVFVAGTTVSGAMLGGFLGGRVFGRGMGFDRLADALGGVMLGALVGVVGSLIVVRRVRIRTRLLLGALGLLAPVGLVLIMKALSPPGVESPPAPPPERQRTKPAAAPRAAATLLWLPDPRRVPGSRVDSPGPASHVHPLATSCAPCSAPRPSSEEPGDFIWTSGTTATWSA